MGAGGSGFIEDNRLIYSIQQTYIIKPTLVAGRIIFTCNQRINVPVIEPITNVQAVVYREQPRTVVPCIELKGGEWDFLDLTFETNEGQTVLPVKIGGGTQHPLGNPYLPYRYVLVLPRGTTGIKRCKLVENETGDEVQHNFTFGIMPPPYNYDNALFGYISYRVKDNSNRITVLENKTDSSKIVTDALKTSFPCKELPKASGKQTINIERGMMNFWAAYVYTPGSSEAHTTKITVSDGTTPTACTLTLGASQNVMIDLLAGTITAFNGKTGEIFQQRKIYPTIIGYKTIEFEDFDDIASNTLTVLITGRGVE